MSSRRPSTDSSPAAKKSPRKKASRAQKGQKTETGSVTVSAAPALAARDPEPAVVAREAAAAVREAAVVMHEAAVAAREAPAAAGPAPQQAPRIEISPDTRRAMVAEAAYLRAERRGFAHGNEVEDWLAAEAEVDRLLESGPGTRAQ